MGIGAGMELEDEDPDRRPTTLLGRVRRFFDRGRGSDSQWHDWWDSHRGRGWNSHRDGAAYWSGGGGWGGCGGSGCDGGSGGGCGGGGCGGGGCGSC